MDKKTYEYIKTLDVTLFNDRLDYITNVNSLKSPYYISEVLTTLFLKHPIEFWISLKFFNADIIKKLINNSQKLSYWDKSTILKKYGNTDLILDFLISTSNENNIALLLMLSKEQLTTYLNNTYVDTNTCYYFRFFTDEKILYIINNIASYPNNLFKFCIYLHDLEGNKELIKEKFKTRTGSNISILSYQLEAHFDNRAIILWNILKEDYFRFYLARHNLDDSYLKKIEVIEKKIGFRISKYMDDRDFYYVLDNYDCDELEKIFALFNTDLSYQNFLDIRHLLLQKTYKIDHKEEVNLFSFLHNNINNKNMVIDYLNLLNEDYLKQIHITKEYLINLYNKYLIKEITAQDYLDEMHKLMDKYIEASRKNYINQEITNFSPEELETIYSDNDYMKSLLSLEFPLIMDILKKVNPDNLNDKQKALLNNNKLLGKCIVETKIKKINETKKYLKDFHIIIKEAAKQGLIILGIDITGQKTHKNCFNICEFIMRMPKDRLKEVLHNEELFNKIKAFFAKYKLSNLLNFDGVAFNTELLEKLGLVFELKDIINIINKFQDYEEIKSMNMVELINFLNQNDEEFERYRYLYGRDIFVTLFNDKEPHSSSLGKSEKLNTVTRQYAKAFYRNQITVPTIDEYLEIDGHRVHIVLGDVLSKENLVLGEKFGSCMRCGGIGSDLWDYCLLNDNGFHLKIYDENENLLTRVSGLRVYNSICFNQIRETLNPNYDANFTFKTLGIVSKMISERDTDIENFFLNESGESACVTLPKKVINFDISDLIIASKCGYFDGFDDTCILVYPDEMQSVKPLSRVRTYPVLRSKPVFYDENCDKVINSLLSFEREYLLGSIDESLISGEFYKDAKCVLVGEDWFIYQTNNNEFGSHVLNGIPEERRKKAMDEMYSYLKLIEEDLNQFNTYKHK